VDVGDPTIGGGSVRTVVGGWVPDGGVVRRWRPEGGAFGGGGGGLNDEIAGAEGFGDDGFGDSGYDERASGDPDEVDDGEERSGNPDEVDDNLTVVPIDDDPDEPVGDHQPAEASARRIRSGSPRLARPFGRLAELWVPESLRDARVDPGRRGMIVLLLVAALAAVATAFGVWRDRPEPRPVETSAVAALAVSSEPAVPESSAPGPSGGAVSGDGEAGAADQSGSEPPAGGSPGEIVVSVTGLVGQPGVVTLNSGSRVADAIAAAGGATADADLTGMNLAARLADGDSVVVDAAPAAGDVASGVSGGVAGSVTAAASAPAGGPIDLNSADEAALDTLPGVGPVMAQNILAWRETNGRFTSIEQLQEISGIGPSRYAQISPLVTVAAG
jgi:competence protein ComEA